jgi:hypothetical protein
MDAHSIKRQALDLAGQLKVWARQIDDGSLKLTDMRQDFENRHQPHALWLVDEMTKLVPSQTPGIIVDFIISGERGVRFSDRPHVATALPANDAENAAIEACVQFSTTARILRQLADAIPEPIEHE